MRKVTFVVLFFVCLVAYWPRYDSNSSVPPGPESVRVAHNLLESHQFANPFATLKTGATAHIAPAFPAFLALLIKIFGDQARGIFAIRLAAVLIMACQVAAFPWVSRTLGMGDFTGMLSAAVWIAAKPRLYYDWEAYYVAAFLMLACCIYRTHLDSEGQASRRLVWLLGALIGLLILMSPSLGPVLAAFVLWEMIQRRHGFLNGVFLPLVLLPIVIIAPWIFRNYLAFHRFVPVRDNLGLELWVSNNDCAQFTFMKNIESGCLGELHPNGDIHIAQKVSELGEPEFNAICMRSALGWISGHPERFAKLTLIRVIGFWMPPHETGSVHFEGGHRRERAAIWITTLLSIIGIVLLHREDPKSAGVCLACLLLFPVVYYVDQADFRYRCPILWVTFLTGMFPVSRLLQRFPRKWFSVEHYGAA